VVVATDGAVVEHNVVGHANQRSQGYNAAIWPWSADNTLIQCNEAYGTKGQRDGEGFDSDWNSKNTIIQYNYSHDNDGGFLLICDDGSQKREDSAGNTGTVVRYNISENDRTRGINIAGPVRNELIYNNTIFVGSEHRVDLLLFTDWNGWAKGTCLRNNIFYAQGDAQFSYGILRDADGAYVSALGLGQSKENVFESNVYYGHIVGPDDPHARTSDPRLVAPGTGGLGRSTLSGYHLLPDSTARGTGIAIENNGGRDFFGAAVPSCGKTDRGASQSDHCSRM